MKIIEKIPNLEKNVDFWHIVFSILFCLALILIKTQEDILISSFKEYVPYIDSSLIEEMKFIAEANQNFIIFWAVLFFSFIVGIIELMDKIEGPISKVFYWILVGGSIYSVHKSFTIYKVNQYLSHNGLLGKIVNNIYISTPTEIDYIISSKYFALWEALFILLTLVFFYHLYLEIISNNQINKKKRPAILNKMSMRSRKHNRKYRHAS